MDDVFSLCIFRVAVSAFFCRSLTDKLFSHADKIKYVELIVTSEVCGFPVGKLCIGNTEQPFLEQHKISHIEFSVRIYIAIRSRFCLNCSCLILKE